MPLVLTSLMVTLVAAIPAAPALAQTGIITGTVVDSTSGETIPGASVVIQGTNQGSISDIDGAYTISGVEPGTYDLQATFIGYQTQVVTGVTVAAGETVEVNFVMSSAAIGLDEVVVVGYGELRRRDVTGSVSSVQGSELAEVATPSVAQALQGKVAGVQVTPSSAEPGEGAVIRIRGIGTLNDASPLYVVDGMLLDDINFLNSNDIESVEVLKDASATAIYGSRGANGVIIITTKRGGFDQPTRFSVDLYAGTQRVQNPIDLVNAEEYAMLANELRANLGQEPAFEDPGAVGPGTDWQDVIFESAPIQSYQVSASGGTESLTYYISGNYITQAGVLPKSNYQRASFRLNNGYQLNDFVQFGHNLNFTYSDGLRAPNVFRSLYVADPTVQPRGEDGSFADASVRANSGNPAATVFYTRNDENGYRFAGNIFAEADFLDNFTFRSSFGLDLDRTSFRQFQPIYFVSPIQQNETTELRVERNGTSSWLWENTLNYGYLSPSGQHRLDVVGGITAQSFYNETLGGVRVNILGESENLWYLNAGDTEGQINFNSAFDWKMLSYLFRTNYSLLDRYLFTFSMRADGSSRFGDENRYGYFPSAAVGWNVAEEAFLRDNDVISDLKLRASWGIIGNDKVGAYPTVAPVVLPDERDNSKLNAVFGENQSIFFGASPIALANPDIRWEETRQTNIGADLAFFDNALQVTADWYRRVTDGILVQVPIPQYVGAVSEPTVNAAEVLNSGIEGNVEWSSNIGPLNFSLGVNGSTINNEVLQLAEGRSEILGGGLGNEIGVTQRTVPGQSIGYFWGYETAGVYQSAEEAAGGPTVGGRAPEPGDLIYVDQNEDGIMDNADRTFLGSPIPDFVYGFNVDLNWNRFDLYASFTGQSGNEIFNGKRAVRFGLENFESAFLDRWHGPGTSNEEPRVTTAGYNYQASERFIEDGSYLKLQTLSLGYTLPQSLMGRIAAQGARIYVSGTNLFTLTGYSGYTPEITTDAAMGAGIDLGVYPTYRTITAGINLTF